MSKILVVTGSVRPNSMNSKVVPLVVEHVRKKGAEVTVADLKELDLPFFDSPVPTSNPEFAPTDERVLRWIDMVEAADGVILVTPEYNHNMSPVQLNAIDWAGNAWLDKPVALIGYGWTSGAHQAHTTAREALAVVLKAKVASRQTNLFITKDIDVDGSVLSDAVSGKIDATLDELLQMTS